jgi:hypothetical protein
MVAAMTSGKYNVSKFTNFQHTLSVVVKKQPRRKGNCQLELSE